MRTMILVLFEVGGQIQTDAFSDDVKIFNKEGFVKINDKNNNLLALYNPQRIIALRTVVIPEKPVNEDGNEALHPVSGAEEQQASSDR